MCWVCTLLSARGHSFDKQTENPWMQGNTYDIGSDQLSCSKKIHPESQQDSQLSAGLVVEGFV